MVEPAPNQTAVIKLRIIPTSEGYYDALNKLYIYHYTDHLGNVRLSYADTNKDGSIQPRQYFQSLCDNIPWDPWNPPSCISIWKPGEIVEVNNYYPFGLLHHYTLTTQNAYQYKYNGKELQETGMYDYGARFYMPDVGRWFSQDPLSEEYRRWSPYNYTINNPISFVDPDGRGVASTGVRDNKDGTYTVVNAKNDGNIGVYITDEKGNYDINSSQKVAETHLPTEFMQANNITGKFEGHINATFSLNPEYNMKINGKSYKNLDGNDIKNIYVNLFKKLTKGMGWYDTLSYLRDNSGNSKKFDIKASVAGFSPESVVMLDGKLTTIRGLGNEIFGANMNVAADKSPFHQDFFYHRVMPRVGAYNQSQNKGATGYNSGWPFYGEHTFSGSYIFHGFYGRFPYRTDIKY
ncbi:RHS repeat-associated core domain-containing protein [Chryseobacterium fluminis]|nr:RHS repeat-associated core domain-containing protein [Chryseobacterium sp. MMS21-Ot14]